MRQLITTRITDEFSVDLRHEKTSNLITYDIDEIIAVIKYNVSIDVINDTFEINLSIYTIDIESNGYDVDKEKWINITEHLGATELLDWTINKIELNDLSEINGISHIEIDFINKVITLENV